ncbi:hypothetical protein JOM56_014870 [Amanita muscaria]
MSQILTRTRRERRPPLAPDQAVRPLTDRGPASARRPPGRISIVIDSDSDYSDESTPCMEEETNALSSSSSVAAIPEVPRPFPLGGVSLLERTPDHGELIYPPQTNEAFQALLGVANDMGFHYKAPENGEETEEQTAQSESDEEESLPTWRQETPPPTTTAPAELRTDAMLLVNVRLKQGFHKHAVLRTLLPQSALGAYECFVTSAEVGVSSMVSILNTMDDEVIMLATSRKPIPMDEKRTHENLMAGYKELGRLSDLDPSVKLKPVIDCDERRLLAQVQEVADSMPIFVIYIWTDDSEYELPSFQTPFADQEQASKASPFIDVVYMNLFQDLVLSTPAAHSTFTLIIFVRIVLEACRKLGINCGRRISLTGTAGPHRLCAEDVIKAFCRADNHTSYLQVKTFANHRGWFFRAEQLFDTLSRLYPNITQIPDDLTDEKLLTNFCKDLLKTPLSNARQLSPRAYGQMTDFVGLLARLEERYGLAKKEKKKGNTGRTGGSSRWNERGGIEPDALEEDID